MKRFFLSLCVPALMLLLAACEPSTQNCERIIKTPAPERPAGQTDVLALAVDAIPTVRVAFIGTGMRGPTHVNSAINIEGVEIVAVCDVEQKNVEKINKKLEDKGKPKAQEFYGDTTVWKKVTELPNVDLIVISTDWKSHVEIALKAMNDGKHVAIEVPAAMSMQEIWDLINTSEKTRKHCMMLENCVYDFFELTTLNMVQNGILGEIIHGEGAYIHGLQPYWKDYWRNPKDTINAGWRMEFNRDHRGDVYPTHGIGPVCQAMNIHRGDKMNYLVCVDTKPIGNPEIYKELTGQTAENFRAGDHTSTLISTEKGKSILIEHNVTSPRPYSRMYQLTGTKGFANKYPMQGYALDKGEIDPEIAADHENLNAHSFVPSDVRKALMEKYKHPIAREIEEKAKEVGGHGGMDFIMFYRMIYCMQKGLPLDMDVYDLAEWCCLIPLTEISLDNGSAPVEIPDFTRGGWNKLNGLKFAQ